MHMNNNEKEERDWWKAGSYFLMEKLSTQQQRWWSSQFESTLQSEASSRESFSKKHHTPSLQMNKKLRKQAENKATLSLGLAP